MRSTPGASTSWARAPDVSLTRGGFIPVPPGIKPGFDHADMAWRSTKNTPEPGRAPRSLPRSGREAHRTAWQIDVCRYIEGCRYEVMAMLRLFRGSKTPAVTRELSVVPALRIRERF